MSEAAQTENTQMEQAFRILPGHAREAIHIGINDLPWVDLGDGSRMQLLHVDLNQGLWVVRTRFAPGYAVQTHYHTGPVFAVTASGSWHYKEYPDYVNTAGSYLFEPAHSVHTLLVPESNTEETEVWFAIYGANVNIDEQGEVVGMVDAQRILQAYREGCAAMGASAERTIVVGG